LTPNCQQPVVKIAIPLKNLLTEDCGQLAHHHRMWLQAVVRTCTFIAEYGSLRQMQETAAAALTF
jgi:hypothetical protein